MAPRSTTPTSRCSPSCRTTRGSASPSSAAASGSRRPPSPSACSGSRARASSRGYRADIDPRALGYTLSAVDPRAPGPAPAAARRRARARSSGEVVECHRITGEDCFFMKAHVRYDRAPRGADRPLHAVRADDDVDHPVVAGPAARARTAGKKPLTPHQRPHSGPPGQVKPPLRNHCSSAETRLNSGEDTPGAIYCTQPRGSEHARGAPSYRPRRRGRRP